MRLMRRASYWLARLVTPRIGAMPLNVFAQQLELSKPGVLVQLPAVVAGFPRTGPVLAAQVRQQLVLDAATAIGCGADVEHGLAAPEHVDPAPLVRRMLDGRGGKRPSRAAHGHSAAGRCNRRAAPSTPRRGDFRVNAVENFLRLVTVTATGTSRAGAPHSGR